MSVSEYEFWGVMTVAIPTHLVDTCDKCGGYLPIARMTVFGKLCRDCEAIAMQPQPIPMPPLMPICSVEHCEHPCEPKSRQCRDHREEAMRHEMRIHPEPTAIESF